MYVSIHYYVLLLDDRRIRLYEAIRDTFIEIRERGFPIMHKTSTRAGTMAPSLPKKIGLREFFTAADEAFGYFYSQVPLWLILAGDENHRSVFQSVTTHRDVILAGVEPAQNLVASVWTVIKEKLAGSVNKTDCDLEAALREKRIVSGIENVWSTAKEEKGTCLLVEEGFYMRGRIREKDGELIIENEVDVLSIMDDALDIIIDKVMEREGRVVFMENGALEAYEKIALILPRRSRT